MANRRLITGGLTLALALAGCQTPQQAQPGWPTIVTDTGYSAAVASQLPVAGRSYDDTIPFLGWTVPLPPGSWTVLINHVLTRKSDDTVLYGAVWLASMPGKTVDSLLRISVTPLRHPSPLKTLSAACTSSDSLASDIRNVSAPESEDCVAVNFIQMGSFRAGSQAMTRQRSNAALAIISDENLRMFAAVDARNKILPPTFVVGNIAMATPQYNVVAELLANPDIAGVPQDTAAVPALSGWAGANLDKDPQKKAFVASTLKLSEQYRLMLNAMLRSPPEYTPPNKLQSTHAIDAHPRGYDAS